MKILWHSTAPWSPSSYSILTSRAVPGLVRDGHNVALGTWYGLQGQPLPWTIQNEAGEIGGKVDVFPAGDGQNFSMDVLHKLYKYVGADVTIVCSDVWPFKGEVTRKINFCPWLPIDHDPAPEPVLEALATAVYPMVYSKWGRYILAESGIDAAYIPCSAPSKIFKPTDKKEARQALGIIDKATFLVGMVAANKDPQDRKGLAEGLQAFALFAKKHEGAYLYLHTNVSGHIKVLAIAERLGIRKRIIQCDPLGYSMGMLDQAYMNQAYNSMDVLLNLSKSEGFGLALLEAQLCGVPIISTDFSTTDELLFAGWKVQGQKHWSAGLDSWRVTANIASGAAALEEAYRERNNKTLQLQARRGALSLDNDRVHKEYWRPALVKIEAIVTGAKKTYDFAKSFEGDAPIQPFGTPADRIVPTEDPPPSHIHRWGKIGLYVGGSMRIPCLNGNCEAELERLADGTRAVNENGFSMTIKGYALDIEDDPIRGVSKIVAREIELSYNLESIDFKDGDVILDIGAHVGVVSIYLALEYPTTRIYAFEPDKDNFKRLVSNLKRNGVTNVLAINSAVTNHTSPAIYHPNPNNSGGGFLGNNDRGGASFNDNGASYRVESLTLADIFRQYDIDTVKLLKIDCEGSEYNILGDASPEILGKIAHIRGEFHAPPNDKAWPQTLIKKLTEYDIDIQVGVLL